MFLSLFVARSLIVFLSRKLARSRGLFLSRALARSWVLFLSLYLAKKVVRFYEHDLHVPIQKVLVVLCYTHVHTIPHVNAKEIT